MPFQKILDSVPEFYHAFLPQVFHLEIPPEPFSNCMDCPMTANSRMELDSDLSKPFAPDTKCCTFTPRLPNYMTGAILSSKDPGLEEGKRRLETRIRSGEGVFPNGVYPTRKYHQLYLEKRAVEFGKNKELLCPWFSEGKFNCTIWRYREAICALWFCKHLAGKKGKECWNAVIDYLKYLQESLLSIAAHRCGLSPVDPYGEGNFPAFDESYTGEAALKQYEAAWKEWAGKKPEYYQRCYEIVRDLKSEEIQYILHKGAPLAEKIENSAVEMVSIPDYLLLDRSLIREDQAGNYMFEITNHIDILQKSIIWSFSLPAFIPDFFDGTLKTSEIREYVLEFHNVNIEPEIIIALYRHGILKDAGI